jgi:heterodisulfide reductase subunit B
MINFYPGCTLGSSAKPYSRSLDWVFHRLGTEMQELPGWSCCGATSAHALNRDLSYALPARNLGIAQETGKDLMVACSACYNRLRVTQRALENPEIRDRMQRLIGKPLDRHTEIKNVLEILVEESNLKRIQAERTTALVDLKIACYYGCLLTRIPRVSGFDSAENPTSMARLAAAAGANVVDWPYKAECCGASFSVINETIALKMCARILGMARRCGADLLVTSCPFCQYNLDWAQWKRVREGSQDPIIPVIFITQLLGLALGGSESELMLSANLIGADQILCVGRTRQTVPLRQPYG